MTDTSYFNQIDHTAPTTTSTKFFKGVTGYQKAVTPIATQSGFDSANILVGTGWTYDDSTNQLTNASSFKGARLALRSKTTFSDPDDPTLGEAPNSFYRMDVRGLFQQVLLGGRSFTNKSFASKPDAAFFTGASTFPGADQNPPVNWLGQLQSSFDQAATLFPRQLSGDLLYNHTEGHRYFHEDGDEVKWYGPSRSFTRYGPWDDTLFLENPKQGTAANYYGVEVSGKSSYDGGRWPRVQFVEYGRSEYPTAVGMTYPSANLVLRLHQSLYTGFSNGFETPDPGKHFSEKRFGGLWSFVTGTQVELTEKKRVFNLGPSFTYTKAAAEPAATIEWDVAVDGDYDKLFEDVKTEVKETGGAVSFHYGDTYSYKKGNSRDVSISGEEVSGGFRGFGIEKMSASATFDGGIIQEKLQRSTPEEDGVFVPFKEKIEGGKYHETVTVALHREKAMTGIAASNLATAATTSTQVAALAVDTKYPSISPPGLGKIWPSINADVFTGGVFNETKLYGLHMRVLMRPVNSLLKIFGKGDKDKTFLALKKDENTKSLAEQKAVMTAQFTTLAARVMKTRADNNVVDQVNELNSKAEAATTEIDLAIQEAEAIATKASATTVNATNHGSRSKLEMRSMHLGVFQVST